MTHSYNLSLIGNWALSDLQQNCKSGNPIRQNKSNPALSDLREILILERAEIVKGAHTIFTYK